MSNNKTSNNGIGFLGLLAIVFITLKLCDVIDWSWLWVLAPIWGPVAIWTVIFAISGLIWVLAIIVNAASKKKK